MTIRGQETYSQNGPECFFMTFLRFIGPPIIGFWTFVGFCMVLGPKNQPGQSVNPIVGFAENPWQHDLESEVTDLSPKDGFGNYPPQMVPRDLNIGETRVWRPNLQPWSPTFPFLAWDCGQQQRGPTPKFCFFFATGLWCYDYRGKCREWSDGRRWYHSYLAILRAAVGGLWELFSISSMGFVVSNSIDIMWNSPFKWWFVEGCCMNIPMAYKLLRLIIHDDSPVIFRPFWYEGIRKKPDIDQSLGVRIEYISIKQCRSWGSRLSKFHLKFS